MDTMTRSVDLFRALIVADHEKGLSEVVSPVDAEEGVAIRLAANAKTNHPDRDVVLQRSTNGPDGPWLRY